MALNSPGVPGSNLPAGEDHIMRRLQDLERAFREYRAADILKTAGLVARLNGLTVVGELDVSGPLVTTGNTTIGGTLGVTGTTTLGATTGVTGALNVSGPMAVTGTLSLPAGIIDNAALANPVSPAQGFAAAAGFSLTVAGNNKITINKTVPAGFSQVVVSAFGRVAAVNSTAITDYLYTDIDIAGAGGNQFGVPVASGGSNTSAVGFTRLVTGLVGGGNVAVSLFASTGVAAWAVNAGNGADLSVTYLFMR